MVQKHDDQPANSAISRRTFVERSTAMGVAVGMVPTALAASSPPGSAAASQASPPATATSAGPLFPEGYIGPQLAQIERLTEEKVTLRIAIPSDPNVGALADNAWARWYEEQTNVHIEWLELPAEDVASSVNTMLASGDYPDVFMGVFLTPAQQLLFGSQQIIIPLNDLIDNVGVHVHKVFEGYPDTRANFTAPDGNMYTLPTVSDCTHCWAPQKLWIYKPWLDTLGLGIPQTLGEFQTVMQAFKDQDPNGNGQADEYPLIAAVDIWDGDAYFMGAFTYAPVEPWLVVNGGTVEAAYTSSGWREGLKYLNQLYAAGLIAPETFTQTEEQLRAIANDPDVVTVGAVPTFYMGTFVQVDDVSGGRWQEYVTVPTLQGPDGTQISPWNYYGPNEGSRAAFSITNTCEDPDLAVRWADGLYTLEVTLRAYHGVPGEHWDWAAEGEIGINGEQGIWKSLVTWTPDNLRGIYMLSHPFYRSSGFRLGQVVDPDLPPFEKVLYDETIANFYPYRQEQEQQLPALYFSEDQVSQVGEFQTTIHAQVRTTIVQAITGEIDINDDAVWESYLSTLEQMGLPQYLQVHQETYDARVTT